MHHSAGRGHSEKVLFPAHEGELVLRRLEVNIRMNPPEIGIRVGGDLPQILVAGPEPDAPALEERRAIRGVREQEPDSPSESYSPPYAERVCRRGGDKDPRGGLLELG